MRGRFPTARRGLLIPWLGWSRRGVGELVLRSMARGWIDLYVIAPTRRRDEVFHRTISELLQESERLRGEGPAGAIVVADARSPRAPPASLQPRRARHSAPDGHRGERAGAGGDARRRPGADRSRAGRADARARLPDRARLARGRSRRRRRRPGRPERGRVRRLGGPADDRARRGRRRRPGRLELADPQLPRLSARPRRRRARPARVPAGLALRGAVPAHAPRDGARAARRPARRPHRQRRRDRGTCGRARARGRVPAPRRPRPDRARGRGRVLRRLDVGGPGAGRRERLHRRRRQLGRAGGAPPGPLRLHGPDPRPRRRPRRHDVAVPDRHDRQGPERARADADRGRGGTRRRPPRAAAAAHAGRDRDRARGRARRPDRRSSAHRVAAGRDRPRRVGLHRHRPRYARAGRSTARRCRSRRACRASSPPATFAPAPSSGSHRPQARARWPSATSTPTSPWSRQLDGPFPADPRRPARAAAGRARDPARRARDGRALGAPPVPLLARALDRRPERRPRVRDRRRGPAARRPARPPRLALVPRGLRLPRPARTRDARRPARQAEPRLRDRDAGRARARRRVRGAVGDRQRADSAQVPRACAARPARALGDRLPLVLPRGRRLGRPGAAVLPDGRALDRRRRLLHVRGRPLPRPLPGAALAARARLHRSRSCCSRRRWSRWRSAATGRRRGGNGIC